MNDSANMDSEAGGGAESEAGRVNVSDSLSSYQGFAISQAEGGTKEEYLRIVDHSR